MKRHGNSGQVLIITSLIVVMLLLAAVIYIGDVGKKVPRYVTESNAVFSAVRVGAVHTLISALANVTNGGSSSVMVEDLDKFRAALSDQSSSAIVYMDYVLNNVSPYIDGIWLSWGTDGRGVSSAYASFYVNYSSSSAERYSEFDVIVTSEITVDGSYVLVDGSTKQVSVAFTLLNEDTPAMASSFTIRYKTSGFSTPGDWITPTSPSIRDFGNGTQLVSFSVSNQTQADPLLVSVYSRDSRGISVMANATCVQV